MYHEETDTPAVARTSNLNEELGQVKPPRYFPHLAINIVLSSVCLSDAVHCG